MMNQLLSSVSKANIKNPENVTLTLQGTTIHSMKELREHFNRDEILAAFTDDHLLLWLQQHYYETEAEQLCMIGSGDNNCFRKICRVFGVNHMDYISLSEEEKKQQKQKEETVKKVISDTKADENLLKELPLIATDQEELAHLIDADEPKIYLCNESFSIPISKPGIEYIGIGDVSIENPFTPEQYRKAGITMTNISLPVTENPETTDAARVAAAANGYDSFHESHSALATLFHNRLKTYRIYEHYHLSFDSSVMGTFLTAVPNVLLPKKLLWKKPTTKPAVISLPEIQNVSQKLQPNITASRSMMYLLRRYWINSRTSVKSARKLRSFKSCRSRSNKVKKHSPLYLKQSCTKMPISMQCINLITLWIRLKWKNTITGFLTEDSCVPSKLWQVAVSNTRSPIFTLPSQKWRMISMITQIPSLIPHSQNINTTVRKSKSLFRKSATISASGKKTNPYPVICSACAGKQSDRTVPRDAITWFLSSAII